MAKKGALWHTDSDMPIQSRIDSDKKDWAEVEKLAVETTQLDFDGLAGPATGPKSSGRNCPKCASRLCIKEMTENSTIVSVCWNCHSTWHHTDLEAVYETNEKGKAQVDTVTDGMWRRIDDSMVNYWMDFFARTKNKEGD